MLKDDCLFCQIIQGKEPASVIYENDKVLAFLNLYPVSKGHAMIVPKEHYPLIQDAKNSYLTELLPVAKKILNKYEKELQISNFNLLINNGNLSGRVVPHLHLHIIPRYKNDKLDFTHTSRQASREELEALKEKIKLNI